MILELIARAIELERERWNLIVSRGGLGGDFDEALLGSNELDIVYSCGPTGGLSVSMILATNLEPVRRPYNRFLATLEDLGLEPGGARG